MRPQAPDAAEARRPAYPREQALVLRERLRVSDGVLGEARRGRAAGPGRSRGGWDPARSGGWDPGTARAGPGRGPWDPTRTGPRPSRSGSSYCGASPWRGVNPRVKPWSRSSPPRTRREFVPPTHRAPSRLRHPVVHHLLQVLARVRTRQRAAHGAEGREVRGADAGTVRIERFHQVRERVNGDNPGSRPVSPGRSGRRVPRRGDREGTAHAEPDREARRPAVWRPAVPASPVACDDPAAA